MIDADKYLERIVAGIQKATNQDADVTWNSRIDGRQFDVVVKFRKGLVSYLVIIEVKNRGRPTSANDIEAFVTKSRDKIANKAIFYSAAGFQSGALSIAKKHGMELFELKFLEDDLTLPSNMTWISYGNFGTKIDTQPVISIGATTPVNIIEEIMLRYSDGKVFHFPSEQSQMNYYCRHSLLSFGESVEEYLQKQVLPNGIQDQVWNLPFNMPIGTTISPPDDYFFPKGKLENIEIKVVRGLGRPISGNSLIDPGTFTCPVEITNVFTNEKHRFPLSELPIDFVDKKEGKFYFTWNPLNYFYCHKITDTVITWYLVESFQNGNLFTAVTHQDRIYSTSYFPVTKTEDIDRLNFRLKAFKESRGMFESC